LTSESTDKWQSIPGPYGIDLNRKTSFYEVLNKEDVIYKGATPSVKEHGPYIYREHDNFSTPSKWDEPLTVPGSTTKKNGIKVKQN
jgi:hypothetical protein